jgi:hypothetical protein
LLRSRLKSLIYAWNDARASSQRARRQQTINEGGSIFGFKYLTPRPYQRLSEAVPEKRPAHQIALHSEAFWCANRLWDIDDKHIPWLQSIVCVLQRAIESGLIGVIDTNCQNT